MEKLQLHTRDYLLIVDDSEIKEGDLVWNGESKPYKWTKEDVEDAFNYKDNKGCKKIIAHLPFDNSPILDGIDLIIKY